MPFNMQGWEWVILIVLALLIFGGSRLAGAGKNAGRALREFKEETRAIKDDEVRAERDRQQLEKPAGGSDVVDAEVVDPHPEQRNQA